MRKELEIMYLEPLEGRHFVDQAFDQELAVPYSVYMNSALMNYDDECYSSQGQTKMAKSL